MAFYCIHCKAKIDSKFKACPHCGEPVTDFLRRYLEDPIDGKYQILSRLGVGGMAEVYKALHIHLNALRVIKVIRPNLAADPGANERFLREARLATKISHPNAATLFDFSMLEDGSHYMVWEYIEGVNLRDLIAQRGALSPRYAAKLAVEALMGLDAIHRAGIVHRDVSPENLMITRDDRGEEHVKVIDLGIAKAAMEETTRSGFVGKWKYCSPEHLGMLPAGEKIDARADVYSFGIVLYEMLAGVPPFQANEPHAYVVLHASQRPASLAEANPAVPPVPELERLAFRALEKDRSLRFATAADFAREIEVIAPDLPEGPGAMPGDASAAARTVEATRPGETRGVEPMTMDDLVPRPPARRRASPALPGCRSVVLVSVAVLAVALGIAGALLLLQDPESPEGPPFRRAEIRATAPAPGFVGLNAYPWARVTMIRNVGTGEVVTPAAETFTPVSFDLAPGPWEITMVNPAFDEPAIREVVVATGSEQVVEVHFADPSLALLPEFGGPQ